MSHPALCSIHRVYKVLYNTKQNNRIKFLAVIGSGIFRKIDVNPGISFSFRFAQPYLKYNHNKQDDFMRNCQNITPTCYNIKLKCYDITLTVCLIVCPIKTQEQIFLTLRNSVEPRECSLFEY